MSDQRRQARDERQKQEAYAQVLERGVADYSRAADHRKELEGALRFAISDTDVLQHALGELTSIWEAMNECIPQAIRVEYEARRVTRSEEIAGGRVM